MDGVCSRFTVRAQLQVPDASSASPRYAEVAAADGDLQPVINLLISYSFGNNFWRRCQSEPLRCPTPSECKGCADAQQSRTFRRSSTLVNVCAGPLPDDCHISTARRVSRTSVPLPNRRHRFRRPSALPQALHRSKQDLVGALGPNFQPSLSVLNERTASQRKLKGLGVEEHLTSCVSICFYNALVRSPPCAREFKRLVHRGRKRSS